MRWVSDIRKRCWFRTCAPVLLSCQPFSPHPPKKSECLIFIQPMDRGMLGPKGKLMRVFSARLKALANHCRRSKKCSSMPPSTQKRTPPKTAGISAIALLLEATGIASKYAWEATAFLLRSNPQTVYLSLPLLLSSY